MTIDAGMKKLAKTIGANETFCISVKVWNARDSDYYKVDDRVEYSVWLGGVGKGFDAPTVAKAVAAAIEGYLAHKDMAAQKRPQNPDDAVAGLETAIDA